MVAARWPIRFVVLALLASFWGCPHDFNRGGLDARVDRGPDTVVDLPDPADGNGHDKPSPPDLYPLPDSRCWPPCVETLPIPLNEPRGVAVDNAGNIYVSESGAHRVRVIKQGNLEDLAGGKGKGYQDGPADQALFSWPWGIAVDAAGTVVYVADSNNHSIRRIMNSTVDTLAGNGTKGSKNGVSSSARFANPIGVTVSAGKVYVADSGNYTIRVIENGTVSTLAGIAGQFGHKDGPVVSALFKVPRDVAVHVNGIFVADGGYSIRLIANNEVSTFAGSDNPGFADGDAKDAKFFHPGSVALHGGKIYVADTQNHMIRVIENGQVTKLAGQSTTGLKDGSVSVALFDHPTGVAVDSTGKIYVADSKNHRIRVIYP